MIRAEMDGRCILVIADAESAPVAATLPGATRTAKMRPFTWRMPLNRDSIAALSTVEAHISQTLFTETERIMAVRAYVDAQKNTGRAEPLRPVPIKPDVQLYAHQIKGYNIVLALFGYALGTQGGDVHKHV